MRAHSSRLVAPSSVLILVPVLALAIDAGACDHHTVVGQDLNSGQGGNLSSGLGGNSSSGHGGSVSSGLGGNLSSGLGGSLSSGLGGSLAVPGVPGSTLSLPLSAGEVGVGSVTIGDWNGDGCGDMATVNQTTGTVSVWLANGDGTFARTDYPTGADPGRLVQGDWNGDHAWDLATPNYTDKSVSVLFGRGDGTFAQASRQATEAGPVALAAGDLNGDGQTDLVSVSSKSVTDGSIISIASTISVWLGTPAGLGPRQDHTALKSILSIIVLGDFDGNGTLDLVGGSTGYGVRLLLGDGTGQFAAPEVIEPQGRGGNLAAADFNQDGHLDLGIADFAGRGWRGGVGLMDGKGSGSFSGEKVLLSQGSGPVLAGDLDRDGYADLAALASDQLNIWHGDEQGFSQTYTTYAASGSSMAMGDLNCDGTPDIAITASTSVSVLFADGDGL